METIHPRGAGRRQTLALVCGVFLAAGITLSGIGPALPYLATRAGSDLAALGGLFTAISSGVILAQFGVGTASDRFGLRHVLAMGLLLMGCGLLGVAFGLSLAILIVCALLGGIGFGCVITAGNVLVARLFAARSAAALNAANLFFGVGSMLGPAIAGFAFARLGAPQGALWTGAGLLLVLTPIVLSRAASPPPARDATVGPAIAPPRTAALWLIGLMLLVYVGTEVGLGAWVTVYMITGASLAPASAALVASGFWLGLTSGRALGAALGLQLAPRSLLAISLLGMIGGAALLSSGLGDPGRSIAGILLLGLSFGPIFPTVLAMVTTAAHGSSASASLVLALGNGGGLIIPALLGVLLSRYGPSAVAAAVLAAVLAMVALCIAAILVEMAPRPSPCEQGTPS